MPHGYLKFVPGRWIPMPSCMYLSSEGSVCDTFNETIDFLYQHNDAEMLHSIFLHIQPVHEYETVVRWAGETREACYIDLIDYDENSVNILNRAVSEAPVYVLDASDFAEENGICYFGLELSVFHRICNVLLYKDGSCATSFSFSLETADSNDVKNVFSSLLFETSLSGGGFNEEAG